MSTLEASPEATQQIHSYAVEAPQEDPVYVNGNMWCRVRSPEILKNHLSSLGEILHGGREYRTYGYTRDDSSCVFCLEGWSRNSVQSFIQRIAFMDGIFDDADWIVSTFSSGDGMYILCEKEAL